MQEEGVFNADETHFQIDKKNEHKFDMRGDENIIFADFVSGEEGMKMMLLLGGRACAEMGLPMMILKNASLSYPLRSISDTVPGACS